MSFSDFEACPRGTEKLLGVLGYALSPDRREWLRSRSSIVPAGLPEPAAIEGCELPGGSLSGIDLRPDRLGRVAAAQMSKISPERAFIVAKEGPQLESEDGKSQ